MSGSAEEWPQNGELSLGTEEEWGKDEEAAQGSAPPPPALLEMGDENGIPNQSEPGKKEPDYPLKHINQSNLQP
jgi:hypothetical protein